MTFLGICLFRRKSALSELSFRLWVKENTGAAFIYFISFSYS